MATQRFLFCLLLSFSILAPAQAQVSKKQMVQLFKTTTYVELTGYKEFDNYLKAAMKKYWTVTPFKIASPDDLETIVNREDISMVRVIGTVSNKTGLDNGYAMIAIFAGGKKKISKYTLLDVAARANFDFRGMEKYSHESGYRVDFLVKELNDDMLFEKEKSAGKKIARYSNPGLLQTKTLLIPQESLDSKVTTPVLGLGKIKPFTDEAFEGYKYAYEIKPMSEIKKLLQEEGEGGQKYCLLVSHVDAIRSFDVYDLATRQLIFHFYATGALSKPPITKKDMENFSAEIAGKK